MKKAALYQRSNGLQRFDARNVLNEFADLFQTRSEDGDSVLDIGCGDGNITMDFLLPKLPKNFKRLIGCDISDSMIDFADKKYKYPNVSFEHFNLAMDVGKQALGAVEKFDHITSFYCLMWVNDQKLAMENIFKLLKPNGNLLVVFLAHHPLYDFYEKQSRDIRWSKHMTDVNEFITPYQYSKDPVKDFRKLLIEAGFIDCVVEARDKCYVFNGVEVVRSKSIHNFETTKNINFNFNFEHFFLFRSDVLNAVNPFIDRFPEEDREDYLANLVGYFVKEDLVLDDFYENSKTCRFAPPYKLMVAHARKPHSSEN